MYLEGLPIQLSNAVILSRPVGITVVYDNEHHFFLVRFDSGLATLSYEGDVKVSLTGESGGLQYYGVKSFQILAKRKGEAGENSVDYEIVPSVGIINADSDGNVLTGPISVKAYRREGKTRTALTLGDSTATDGYKHWLQYSIDNGTWNFFTLYYTNGATVTTNKVRSVQSELGLRLVRGSGRGTAEEVKILPPITVVRGGSRGAPGPWWFPAGSWDVRLDYTRTDGMIPVVEHEGYYYYPKDAGTIQAGESSPDQNSAWSLATQFEFVFTKVLFASFAKLGSAVINGDWIISQHGTVNGRESTDYTSFAAKDPEGNVSGHFRPNLAWDMLKGKAYINAAEVSGTVRADNFYVSTVFIGDIITDPWIGLLYPDEFHEDDDYPADGEEKDLYDNFTEGSVIRLSERQDLAEMFVARFGTVCPTGWVYTTGSAQKVIVFPGGGTVFLPSPSLYPGKMVEVYNQSGVSCTIECVDSPADNPDSYYSTGNKPHRNVFVSATYEGERDYQGLRMEAGKPVVGEHNASFGFSVANGKKATFVSIEVWTDTTNNIKYYFWALIEKTNIK